MGLGFKIILKRNNKDRTLHSVNAGAGAVHNDDKIKKTIYIMVCTFNRSQSNDNSIKVPKRIKRK